MGEALRLEGLGKPSDRKKASRERESAAKLFTDLQMFRRAATQFQIAGEELSSSELLLKAADNWERCTKSAGTGRALLYCLNSAGSPAYSRLLSALELDWVSRDSDYVRIFENFAYKYGEEAPDRQVTRIANLFETFDERVSFLEDLDKKSLVEQLLKADQAWEKLAIIHEERLDLEKAMEFWQLAGRKDILANWEAAEHNIERWRTRHLRPRDTSLFEPSKAALDDTSDAGNHPYFELCEYVRLLQSQHQLLLKRKLEPDVGTARDLLNLVERWHSRFADWAAYATHLCSGSLPGQDDTETLGIYPAHFGNGIHLISVCQRDKWIALDTSPSVEGSLRRVPLTTAQLTQMLGAFCKSATKEAERKAFEILTYLAKYCVSLSETATNFDLRADTAVSEREYHFDCFDVDRSTFDTISDCVWDPYDALLCARRNTDGQIHSKHG